MTINLKSIIVTSENINQIKETLYAIQDEIQIGHKISAWNITFENNQSGFIALFENEKRATIQFNGIPIWGDYNTNLEIIFVDETMYDFNGKEFFFEERNDCYEF